MIFEVWTENHLKAMGILNWETDKAVLINESKASNRPKMKNLTFRRPRRPKRRSQRALAGVVNEADLSALVLILAIKDLFSTFC